MARMEPYLAGFLVCHIKVANPQKEGIFILYIVLIYVVNFIKIINVIEIYLLDFFEKFKKVYFSKCLKNTSRIFIRILTEFKSLL